MKYYSTHVTGPDGKRHYVRGHTPEERDQRAEELKTRLALGMEAATYTTFAEYSQLWLQTYKPKGSIRDTSYGAITNTLNNHVAPFFSNMRLDAIKPMHIQLYLNHLTELGRSQQQKCWAMTKQIFQTAVDNHLISESPIKSTDRLRPCAAQEDEEPLTDEQAKALLAATEGTSIYLFILLALCTGMRRGEILGLMWEDIDFEQRCINVRHNKAFPANANDAPVTELLKTDAGRRKLPIADKLYAELQKANDGSSEYVLHSEDGSSLSRSAFRSRWLLIERRTAGGGEVPRDLGKTYGDVTVALDFHTHPHQLRHTYITQLFEAGLDMKQVQYLAGHANPEMTLRIYTHYRRDRDSRTAEQVCQALNYLG